MILINTEGFNDSQLMNMTDHILSVYKKLGIKPPKTIDPFSELLKIQIAKASLEDLTISNQWSF